MTVLAYEVLDFRAFPCYTMDDTSTALGLHKQGYRENSSSFTEYRGQSRHSSMDETPQPDSGDAVQYIAFKIRRFCSC